MSTTIEGGHVLFTQGAWEIHADITDSEWVEIFHHCQKWNTIKDQVEYSYQHPDDPDCPGCGETQPDEIQALAAMHNMDKPPRVWGRTVMEQVVEQEYNRIYKELRKELKDMSLTGDGISE